jgi:hypothetical protein
MLPERPDLLLHHHQLCTGTRSWVDQPSSLACRVVGAIYLL